MEDAKKLNDQWNAIRAKKSEDMAQKLIDMCISAKLFKADCSVDETHGCVVVWSANAQEQIAALVAELIGPKAGM